MLEEIRGIATQRPGQDRVARALVSTLAGPTVNRISSDAGVRQADSEELPRRNGLNITPCPDGGCGPPEVLQSVPSDEAVVCASVSI